jgi:hypothetical protein
VNVDEESRHKGIISMNYLVYLNAQASELEKILSGVKTMVLREIGDTQSTAQEILPGDSLFFLRNKDDSTLRGKATVARVICKNHCEEGLSQFLKEMQPRLQLTENQYKCWSEKEAILIIEFEAAQKIPVRHVAPDKIVDRSNWIAFTEFSQIAE